MDKAFIKSHNDVLPIFAHPPSFYFSSSHRHLPLNRKKCICIISNESVSQRHFDERRCVRKIDALFQQMLHCSFLVENKRSPGFPSDMAITGYTVILCKWGIQLQVTVLAVSIWCLRQQRLWKRKCNFKQEKLPEALTAAHPSPLNTTSIPHSLILALMYFIRQIYCITCCYVALFNAVWFSRFVCCNHGNSSQPFFPWA